MGNNSYDQNQPEWHFKNDGKEIYQPLNSAPGIAIGSAQLSGVDFEGTFIVNDTLDGQWVGFVFSFQVKIS